MADVQDKKSLADWSITAFLPTPSPSPLCGQIEKIGTLSFSRSYIPGFPRHSKGLDGDYRPNTIADVLKRRHTLNKLSKNDIAALGDFFPEFIHKHGPLGSGKKKLFVPLG